MSALENGRRALCETVSDQSFEMCRDRTWRVDESDVVAAVDAAALDEQAGDALGALVQLGARQGAGGRALGAEQREQHVVGRTLRAPLQDLRYEAVLRNGTVLLLAFFGSFVRLGFRSFWFACGLGLWLWL